MAFRGDGELVPGGISGDFMAQADLLYPRLSSPDLGRIAYFSELADRFESGAITSDEEAELIAYLQRSVVHDTL